MPRNFVLCHTDTGTQLRMGPLGSRSLPFSAKERKSPFCSTLSIQKGCFANTKVIESKYTHEITHGWGITPPYPHCNASANLCSGIVLQGLLGGDGVNEKGLRIGWVKKRWQIWNTNNTHLLFLETCFTFTLLLLLLYQHFAKIECGGRFKQIWIL